MAAQSAAPWAQEGRRDPGMSGPKGALPRGRPVGGCKDSTTDVSNSGRQWSSRCEHILRAGEREFSVQIREDRKLMAA